MPLTPRQKRFVDEYLIDLNATQAAIRAGYSPKTATEQSSRLLTNVKVIEAVEERRKARAERTEVTQDWVLERLKLEAEREGEGSSASARVAALKVIAQHKGMLTDKVEVTEKKDLKLTIQVVDARQRTESLPGPA